MTKLTQDQVRHIARLARLRLREDEVEKYANELTKILGFIEQLSEVDTKNVEPTAQVTGMQNRFRDDEMGGIGTSPDALLHVSPLPIVDHQIVTPSAHG
ncbi:MAG: Asp-tRNA(Asn)/Glu-tRNA(Gln) amidotransferase subunit GatC [Patescibacteria group bacterium]